MCAVALAWSAAAASDPYASLDSEDVKLLRPAVERWAHDQIKHDWSDMWNIQEQTPELKNELLLGRRDAPDMDQEQYVQAMRETIGSGYPEIKAFVLRDVQREAGGYRIAGCSKLQREEWKQTSISFVHATVSNGKVMFGLPHATAEACKL